MTVRESRWSNHPPDGKLHCWHYIGMDLWQTFCLIDAMRIEPPPVEKETSDLPICERCRVRCEKEAQRVKAEAARRVAGEVDAFPAWEPRPESKPGKDKQRHTGGDWREWLASWQEWLVKRRQ